MEIPIHLMGKMVFWHMHTHQARVCRVMLTLMMMSSGLLELDQVKVLSLFFNCILEH